MRPLQRHTSSNNTTLTPTRPCLPLDPQFGGHFFSNHHTCSLGENHMITGAEVRVMMGISSNARNQEKHIECALSYCWQGEHGLLISWDFCPQWNIITFCHFKLSSLWHFATVPVRNCWDSGFMAPDITDWHIIRCLFSEIVDIVVNLAFPESHANMRLLHR